MEKKVMEGVSILVAEDDPSILDLLRVFFISQGAEVEALKDGQHVMQRIAESSPDICVLDVVMPYMDGFTILERLRANPDRPAVIMLTDQGSMDDKVRGLDTGADDYVTKPFSTRELLARMQSVLRRMGDRRKDGMEQAIKVGPIDLLPLAREARVADGKVLKLTKTEFDLLHYLALQKMQVVSHSSLLKDVLGYRSDIETKALVMHIANMRKKLAKDCLGQVKIETVAGVGYKLVAG